MCGRLCGCSLLAGVIPGGGSYRLGQGEGDRSAGVFAAGRGLRDEFVRAASDGRGGDSLHIGWLRPQGRFRGLLNAHPPHQLDLGARQGFRERRIGERRGG